MSQMDDEANGYTIGVMVKMADILSAFSHAQPSLTLKDVMKATKLPKTTAFRILSTLVSLGYCDFDPRTGEYSLGFVFLKLADIRRRQANVHAVAIPVMREIRNESKETVALSVRSGEQRVHIDFMEGLHPLRRTTEIGVGTPLYVGAASKVLLAGMPDGEIDAYLARTPLKRFQDTTITDPDALRREIAQIRRLGYAESRGELYSGGGGLAAPLKDWSENTVAAIDVLTPDSRYTPEHREACIKLLIEGAASISERLGYRADTRRSAGKRAGPPARIETSAVPAQSGDVSR